MRKIKFDNLQSNWFYYFNIIILSLYAIGFEIIEFENPKINRNNSRWSTL
jgi:hypothetical protein